MNNFLHKIAVLFLLAGIFGFSGLAAAQNKVVVVPLGGDAYEDPTNGLRTLQFDANGIGGTVPTNADGLVFSDTFNSLACCASLAIKRPANWDGDSSVTVELFTHSVGTGTGRFRIFTGSHNGGDQPVTSFPNVGSDTRDFTQESQFQVFTTELTAASLPKDWWQLIIQRKEGTGTNTTDITVYSIAVSYTAMQ